MRVSKSKIALGLIIVAVIGVVLGCHEVSAKVANQYCSERLLDK